MDSIMKNVMTVAGSDSCGGAGIQADLKTFAALGVYGLSVITAVTAQNTLGVNAAAGLDPELVTAQLQAVMEDIPVAALKTGMLYDRPIIEAVAACLTAGVRRGGKEQTRPLLVVDPVMVSQSGHLLLQSRAIESLKTRLLPLARIATPNIPEAEVLCGRSINGIDDMVEAGRELLTTGCTWIVITGGHLPDRCVDVAVSREQTILLDGERIITANNHGTGCTFSAAAAALLARGASEPEAIRGAKTYVETAIRHGFAPGRGHGVLNHFPGREPVL